MAVPGYIPMDVLRTLEKQSGLLRLIVYLAQDGEKPLTEILDETDIPVHQLYSSIEKGKAMDLIANRIENETYPPKNLVFCTTKGRKVARKLLEIKKIVESGALSQ
jgi:DNA-binding MarR family transcriptional regulator